MAPLHTSNLQFTKYADGFLCQYRSERITPFEKRVQVMEYLAPDINQDNVIISGVC